MKTVYVCNVATEPCEGPLLVPMMNFDRPQRPNPKSKNQNFAGQADASHRDEDPLVVPKMFFRKGG
jgi:hypothetical protein